MKEELQGAEGWGGETRPSEMVLIVCTANRCRSPLAEALLIDALHRHGTNDVTVGSAGFLPSGHPAEQNVLAVLHNRRIDLSTHLSTKIDADIVSQASLILTMERAHAREIVVLDTRAWAKTFTLLDFAERAMKTTPRGDEGMADYLVQVGKDRTRSVLLSKGNDEVADPMGKSKMAFEDCARQLSTAIDAVGRQLWGWQVDAPHTERNVKATGRGLLRRLLT